MAGSIAGTIERPPSHLPDETTAHSVQPRQPSAAVYPLIGLAYFVAAVFAIHLSSDVGNIASFWTAGAILLTALIRCRVETWKWLLASAGTADLAANLLTGGSVAASFGIAFVDMLEVVAVVMALRWTWDGRPWFLSMRWIAVFGLSSVIASLGAATLGSLWLNALGETSFMAVWQTWVLADALGFFAVTPFLLSWTDPSFRAAVSRHTTAEIAGVTALLATVSALVFIGTLPFLFLMFPLLVLLALRGGLLGATTGVVVLAFIGTWFTVAGSGPIAALSSSSSTRIFILQIYLFSAAVSTLSIALIMTQRRRLAKGLEQQTVISHAALDNMTQGLSMFDDEHRLVTCNRRYRDIYQLPAELCAPGTPLTKILEYHTHAGIYAGSPEEYLEALQLNAAAAFEVSLSGGQIIQIKRQRLARGGWVSTHEDITEQRLSSDRISYLARHDALTGTYNRSHFGEELQQALASAKRGHLVALHSVDLDRFKEVNDTLGHPAGDEILRQAAGRLLGLVRSGDVVARVGGDEFCILQRDVKGEAQAAALAERALDSLRTPFDASGHPVVIGATVGVALGDGEICADELMKRSDLALYRGKQEGRDIHRVFEQTMDASLQAQRLLEQELSCAVRNGELELVYQPILNLETKAIAGFEALVRWNHPARGLIAPADFISVAEDRGLIISIGEWVLREACSKAAGWPDDIAVAVNLSSVQFKAEGLVDVVAAALSASNLAPHRLELEVTESVLLLDSKSVLRTFRKLRAQGIRLAMDDFGTGYSSLSYLRKFQFDKIKIDRSFIAGIRNDDSLAILQATIALATKLGMTSTAEGVETAQQLAVVRLEGCTEAQGYFISKPLSSGGVRTYLEKQNRIHPAAPPLFPRSRHL